MHRLLHRPYDENPVFYERLRELPFPEVMSTKVTRRRRNYLSAAPPLPLVGVSIEMMREHQQNDSLADGC